MSVKNFVKTVWAKEIQDEIKRKCRLAEWCNTEFEGQARHNEEVIILGLGDVTTKDYTGADIDSAEELAGTDVRLKIDQAKYFNIEIKDVDKAIATPGLMDKYVSKASYKFALDRDKYIGTLAQKAGALSASTQINTKAAAKSAIDTGILWLRENDVDESMEVVIELPWFFYQLFKDNLIDLKTQNDELIKKGIIAMYDNCYVRTTNNLYSDGTDSYCMIRTKEAIAFAGGIDEIEAYRPQNNFKDAVKGLNTFGGKVVRPKELYTIKAHK